MSNDAYCWACIKPIQSDQLHYANEAGCKHCRPCREKIASLQMYSAELSQFWIVNGADHPAPLHDLSLDSAMSPSVKWWNR